MIAPGEKFAVIAVTDAWLSDTVAAETDLGHGLWVMRDPPVPIGRVWGGWLGEITVRELERAGLWIFAKIQSSAPRVQDADTERLKEAVGQFFHALLLSQPIHFGLVFRLTGGNDGRMSIRSFEGLDHYYSTPGLEAPLDAIGVQLAKRVMDGLVTLHAASAWQRLLRGLWAFSRGLMERYLQDRLHQFVRCLEGATKPAIGNTRGQFTHRCQTFTRANPETRQVFEDAFDIRSYVEHLHDWANAVPHWPTDQHEERLSTCVRRIETLSRNVYQRLILDVAIRDRFQDANMDAFWQMQDHERRAIWGAGIDLMSIR